MSEEGKIMGRHRRSAADDAAATGHGAQGSYTGRPSAIPAPRGIAPYLNPEAYSEAGVYGAAYSYGPDDETYSFTYPSSVASPASSSVSSASSSMSFATSSFTPAGGGHRRRKKKVTPVRAGLLGVSAAVALGTVAVATGAVPGLDGFRIGGGTGGGDRVQAADDSAANAASGQGGTSGSADGGRSGGDAGGVSTSRGSGRAVSPVPSAPTTGAPAPAPAPAQTPSTKPTAPAVPSQRQSEPAGSTAPAEPTGQATKDPDRTTAPASVAAQVAAQAKVLKLVNAERSKAGCDALTASAKLTDLAEAFSDDMALRDFFDHTDPDGASPWDRAEKAGITGLGGENIARGQADAEAVMEAWMDSSGHRANILNCDFKTLGVGVHLGSGGPWWTQDFGY